MAYLFSSLILQFGKIYAIISYTNKMKFLGGDDMHYVLLLRGINVGGKHKVVMSELKNQLHTIGFQSVSSYINSGNLFFESELEQTICATQIKTLLKQHYSFEIPFALMKRDTFLQEYQSLPDWWHTDLARKDALFFSEQVDKATIQAFIETSALHNEIVHIGELAVYWGKYDESEYLKTTYHKNLLKQPFYKQITVRNGNTTNKIATILLEPQS